MDLNLIMSFHYAAGAVVDASRPAEVVQQLRSRVGVVSVHWASGGGRSADSDMYDEMIITRTQTDC